MTGDPEPIQDPAQQLYDVLGYLQARLHHLGLAAVALVAGFALGRLFDHTRGYLP